MGRIPQRRFCGKKEAASSIIRAGSECRHATGHGGISRRYGNIKPRQLSWENPSHLPLGSFSRLGTGADRIGRDSFTRLVVVHATDTRSPVRFSTRMADPFVSECPKDGSGGLDREQISRIDGRISTSKCLQAFHFLPFLHGLLRFLLNLGRSRSRFSRKFSHFDCSTEWSQGKSPRKSFHVIREA